MLFVKFGAKVRVWKEYSKVKLMFYTLTGFDMCIKCYLW